MNDPAVGGVTVFRDKPPKGVSFPLSLTDAAALLGDNKAALYFVYQSTWLRQTLRHGLTTGIPVLRIANGAGRRLLRVGNERVDGGTADACTIHVFVYGVPSEHRAAIRAGLLSAAARWHEVDSNEWFVTFSIDDGSLAARSLYNGVTF